MNLLLGASRSFGAQDGSQQRPERPMTDGLRSHASGIPALGASALTTAPDRNESPRDFAWKGGDDVKLRPKSFEVLRLLIERHGRLVSKDVLLHAVWGSTVVSEGALTQCLIDVRRAIGDESQRMIRTVPRRGYIFDVPVTESSASSSPGAQDAVAQLPAPAPRPFWNSRYAAAALLALAAAIAVGWWAEFLWWAERRTTEPAARSMTAPRNSIAVLPFVDMSPEQNQEYFSDGISEEILNVLAQTPTLRVIARTSSFSFKRQSVDIPTIAARLNVAHVLEGSVRKSGNRVRVTAQLVDANSLHLVGDLRPRIAGRAFGADRHRGGRGARVERHARG